MPFEFNQSKFEIDENGFMRSRCRFLACGIMQYAAHELGEVSPTDDPDQLLNIFVPMDTLSDPRAIRSLEGMPVVANEHVWIDGSNKEIVAGSIAGTPQVNGPYLEGEIVITDPNTIKAIQDGLLSDISAGYNARYIMEPGEYDGNLYDGKQTEIRYNHIALLSPGSGRGGREIRVLNNKGKVKMPETTAIKLGDSGQTVRVLNDDAQVLSNYLEAESKKVQTMNAEASQLEEKLAALDEKNKQIESLNAEAETLKGELAAIKEKLDAAMNPETIEEAANELMEEKEDAAELLTANVGEMDKEKAMNSLKGLSGHALRLEVVNKIRTTNGLEAISDKEAENENFVSGQYNAFKAMPVNRKKTVNGATAATKTQNSEGSNRKVGTKALGY